LALVAPGETSVLNIALNVPDTVQRFALSEGLTMADYAGVGLSTTASQTLFVDATAPAFLVGPRITVTATTMTITWETSEPATSRLYWGIGTSTNRIVAEDSVLKTSHSVAVNGLLPNTTYSVIASGHDQAGNVYFSSTRSARTTP
jgi:hypothetical protein